MNQDSTTGSAAEGTIQQLDELFERIEQLAAADLTPQAFYAQLVDHAVRGLAAAGGAAWRRDGDSGDLLLDHQVNLAKTKLGTSAAEERHARLLFAVMAEGQARIASPHSGLPGQEQAGNPTDFLVTLCPVIFKGEALAVVELFHPPGASPSTQQGYARVLEGLCSLAADFHRQHQFRQLRLREEAWGKFEQFVERVHGSLNVDATVFAIANDGREVIDCDRLSVAVARGRKCPLAAISGLETFSRRSPAVRGLQQIVNRVRAAGEPLWYFGDSRDLPPQIEKPLNAYLDHSHARMLAVVPLVEPKETARGRPRMLGLLVAERFDAELGPEAFQQRVAAVVRHGQAALSNALTYHRIPFLRSLRLFGWFFQLHRLPKTLLALAVIVAAVSALVYVPADFTIEARGELQPQRRADVFAPMDGIVRRLYVKQGDRLPREGTGQATDGGVGPNVLAELTNPPLENDYTKVLGDLSEVAQRLDTLGRLRARGPRTAEERERLNQLTAEEEELKKRRESLQKRRDILQRQLRQRTIASPIAGEVLTWNVDQLLENRPVRLGQLLMKVADLDGPWMLEIRVADHDIAHVLQAQAEQGERLSVTFVLATAPEVKYAGRVQAVSMITETDSEGESTVLVTVAIEGPLGERLGKAATAAVQSSLAAPESEFPSAGRRQFPEFRPAATVVARIDCGRRPLGYVWFHDLIDAVRTWIW